MFGTFKEYHNSLDDEKFINFKTIIESLKIYYNILLTLENNFIPVAKITFGTPQLSKSKINLYPSTMNNINFPPTTNRRFLLQVLNLAEGKKDLLDICLEKKFKLVDHIEIIKKLLKSKYITKK